MKLSDLKEVKIDKLSMLLGFVTGYKYCNKSTLNILAELERAATLRYEWSDTEPYLYPIAVYVAKHGHIPTKKLLADVTTKAIYYSELIGASIADCINAKREVTGEKSETIKRYNAALGHYASEFHKLINFKSGELLSPTDLKMVYKKYKALLHTKQLMFKYYDDIIEKPSK